MIQGLKTKLNPIPQGGGGLNLTFSYFSKGSRLCKRLRFGMYATLKPRNRTPIPTPVYLFNPPYLTLCRRDGGGDQKFLTQNIFQTQIFLDSRFSWTPNIFGPTIFFDPT